MIVWLAALAFAGSPVLDAVEASVPFRNLRLGHDAPRLSDDVYLRAERGERVTGIEYVDGVRAGKGWGVAVIEAPVDDVWAAVNDHDGFRRDGTVALSRYLSGREGASGQRTLERLDLPIVNDRWWVQEIRHNADLYRASGGRVWELFARAIDGPIPAEDAPLVEGGVRITWSVGGWLLVPVGDGRTLAEYWIWSDPGGAIPAGLASRFAAGAIKGLFDAVEARAQAFEEGHPQGFVKPDQSRL